MKKDHFSNHEELKQLKGAVVSDVREEILDNQDGCCDICGIEIDENTGSHLDHQHKFKSEENGVNGNGLVRGVLCRSCNVLEGKIWNNMTRFAQPKNVQDRIDFLENLIKYYESGTYPLIHPKEAVKEQKVSKRNYNKLKKEYSGKRKFPEYPKSEKLTKQLKILFEEYGISPYN